MKIGITDLNCRRASEKASTPSEHVILVPGPLAELKTIERVYAMFIDQQCKIQTIANSLNADGIQTGTGKAWRHSMVRDVLSNDKYIGSAVYNRTSKKLNGNWRRNPREEWIRCEGAFQAVVSKERFEQAQQRLEAISRPLTNNDRLDLVTALWCQRGHLSSKIVDRAEIAPCCHSYAYHFGSMARAFRMIGFRNRENLSFNTDLRKMVIDEVRENRSAGRYVRAIAHEQAGRNQFRNQGSDMRQSLGRRTPARVWQFGYRAETKPDIVLGARVLKRVGQLKTISFCHSCSFRMGRG